MHHYSMASALCVYCTLRSYNVSRRASVLRARLRLVVEGKKKESRNSTRTFPSESPNNKSKLRKLENSHLKQWASEKKFPIFGQGFVRRRTTSVSFLQIK